MNIFLWILQVLLAAAFLAHGLMFLFPSESVAAQMNQVIPRAFQLFLGVAEVLAAIGLTLPGITRIKPWLVPAAAAGVMIVTISATILHVSRGDPPSSAITTAILFVLATFVAWVRWKVRPIQPRSPVSGNPAAATR